MNTNANANSPMASPIRAPVDTGRESPVFVLAQDPHWKAPAYVAAAPAAASASASAAAAAPSESKSGGHASTPAKVHRMFNKQIDIYCPQNEVQDAMLEVESVFEILISHVKEDEKLPTVERPLASQISRYLTNAIHQHEYEIKELSPVARATARNVSKWLICHCADKRMELLPTSDELLEICMDELGMEMAPYVETESDPDVAPAPAPVSAPAAAAAAAAAPSSDVKSGGGGGGGGGEKPKISLADIVAKLRLPEDYKGLPEELLFGRLPYTGNHKDRKEIEYTLADWCSGAFRAMKSDEKSVGRCLHEFDEYVMAGLHESEDDAGYLKVMSVVLEDFVDFVQAYCKLAKIADYHLSSKQFEEVCTVVIGMAFLAEDGKSEDTDSEDDQSDNTRNKRPATDKLDETKRPAKKAKLARNSSSASDDADDEHADADEVMEGEEAL